MYDWHSKYDVPAGSWGKHKLGSHPHSTRYVGVGRRWLQRSCDRLTIYVYIAIMIVKLPADATAISLDKPSSSTIPTRSHNSSQLIKDVLILQWLFTISQLPNC